MSTNDSAVALADRNTAESDVMPATARTTGSAAKLGDASTLMRATNYRHLPVADGKDLAGIVSARDPLNQP